MSASKSRPRWADLPSSGREVIERLVCGQVVAAASCAGGFSPGFASRLRLADGRRIFVKAMDGMIWPDQREPYRVEAWVAAGLPDTVPAPRLLGWVDDGRWLALAFESIEGTEPVQPWRDGELERVAAAVGELSLATSPSPIGLPREHPRLGGWADLVADRSRVARLPRYSGWAARNLETLVALELEGLAAAQGDTLVHFDAYPHNVLLTAGQVIFVDWPHARLGAPYLDLLMLLSSAAADAIDPEPIVRRHPLTSEIEPRTIDAVLAAHGGFLLGGGLESVSQAFRPIVETKRRLGLATVSWLERRLNSHRPARRAFRRAMPGAGLDAGAHGGDAQQAVELVACTDAHRAGQDGS